LSGEATRFAYKAVKDNGETLSDSIMAPDRATALRKLSRTPLTIISLEPAGRAPGEALGSRRRKAARLERRMVLKQLSVMAKSGVELLEGLETVRSSLPEGRTRDGLGEAAARLRRGERIATAIAAGIPEYPRYVTALIAAGEASGHLDRVLGEASAQLTAEDRISRDVRAALIYPAFLVSAGFLVMLFLFYVIVPRFAAMLGPQREALSGLPNLILTAGETFRSFGPIGPILVVLPLLLGRAALSSDLSRRRVAAVLSRLPGFRDLVLTRQRAGWTRIMSFGISAGVGVLGSARLAMESVPEGRLRSALAQAIRGVRAGRPVSDAMADPVLLTPMDLSLVRVGQRSGALAEMFAAIADYHEEVLLERLKRATVVVEQLAIALVALAIGLIVISLVSAMTSVYESIG
jgi:type II secretory pathway component PulF